MHVSKEEYWLQGLDLYSLYYLQFMFISVARFSSHGTASSRFIVKIIVPACSHTGT
jgi:hypothetical protein